MKPPVITLLTDFGTRDGYVAQMKGVILGIAPECTIVDLTHEVPPQDIGVGAMRLQRAASYFPSGSVHIAVVDPGVGTARAIVAAEIGEQRFVAPDNGLLSYVLKDLGLRRAVYVENKDFCMPAISNTFHGRDIMAPIAAHWAQGVSISELGPPAKELKMLAIPESVRGVNEVVGRVMDVDRFGNAILNLLPETLSNLDFRVACMLEAGGSSRAVRQVHAYGDVARGTLVLLTGSQGWMELAVTGSSAAELLQIGIGAKITLRGD